MIYIILAAGEGQSLAPLTVKYPKTSYKLDSSTTIIQRMVGLIRKLDDNAEIVAVVGYRSELIKKELEDYDVKFVINPFYKITGSISSLWFARKYLERDNITILHGDVVFDDDVMRDVVVKPTDRPYVVIDSSCTNPDSYSVGIKDDEVLVMGTNLDNPHAEYCCMTKLDAVSGRILKEEISQMVENNVYDIHYEDSLVHMIMFSDFDLYYEDIKGCGWKQINDINDVLKTKYIHRQSEYRGL